MKNMLTEMLEKKYGKDEPIFYDDIIKLLENYSKAQVCRYIKKAKEDEELVQFSRGVYYIPHTTFLGTKSSITSDNVMIKRYIKNDEDVFGVYSGSSISNYFSITTQVPSTIEIVTNNEATRCRKINILGRDYIVRKSRVKITKDNYSSYTLLQLFNDMFPNDEINDFSKNEIKKYALENNITKDSLMAMASFFPSKASKNMLRSGILNEIA